jgi:hypothetical protein
MQRGGRSVKPPTSGMYNSDRVTRVAAGAYSLATPDPIVHYPLDDVTNKIELYEEWCSLDVLSDNL